MNAITNEVSTAWAKGSCKTRVKTSTGVDEVNHETPQRTYHLQQTGKNNTGSYELVGYSE